MNKPHGINFWIGNAVLVVAFICLFDMDALSALLGIWAMIMWMVLAAIGFYLIYRDNGPSSSVRN
jgi:hypothetical protein